MTGQVNDRKSKIVERLRSDWPLITLVLATFLVSFFIYPHLPERVPSHWNFQGEVDNYSSRFWGAFAIPLMSMGIYLLMLVTPYIDPRRRNYAKFTSTYQVLKAALICFFTGLYVIIVMTALGYNVSVERLVPLGISLLILIIGNMMGRIRHNYFVGIKVPWTLASEEVWRKTHRLGAPMWVGAGLLGILGAIIGGKATAILFFVPLGLAVIIPVVYSYISYKRLYS
ncbi:MAG: SdpI family protein [Clostridiales bacterium]|nr:SdpI family protein [Clostridiales bacterium]MCF8022997.1 SdpI family protein [Clostridiales bacterium]